ncbi:unnamed protein product [Ceutorhynchus assimilis]|uniref:Methyltransferase-like protein 17, mitochondrial n=1 Tax=Ceutorhynchus assimilis TaxID=467358 RepID=A0A9N9MFN4_9CUCU|nr:unnamed protein product [Ceutorhynchus assimilis]
MILNKIIKPSCSQCLKNFSSSATPKPKVVPDTKVLEDISNQIYKPRLHPGVFKTKTFTVPDTFVKAAIKTLEDYPVKSLVEAGRKLSSHLTKKVPPLEREELSEHVEKIKQKLIKRYGEVTLENPEDAQKFKHMIKEKVNFILRENTYNWKPMKYDTYNSLVYLLGRAPAEYAVLSKIFGEIAQRDTDFTPRSLFDFGSGIGTVTWAANSYWKKHIYEYYNVDSSAEMNDLAQILLQGGTGTGNSMIKGTFYRQFLPASNVEYDLVTSAYSLMELPSLTSRLETVLNLWNKTKNYLVIVEHGTNAGYKVVNEVRDFILQIDKEGSIGHVFSPCSHDKICPRFLAKDGTPCNYEIKYFSMPIGQKPDVYKELYSYVVLKKGPRQNEPVWPRIVRPTLVRSKHSICRVCTAGGNLDEVIFTAKKHGKMTYHCARSSKWGDLLPVTLEENAEFVDDDNDENIPN